MAVTYTDKEPFGLSSYNVAYVIAKLGLEGLCDYGDGIFWVPKNRSDEVYELVKDYASLKKAVQEYQATGIA